jgi:hypothetical protein
VVITGRLRADRVPYHHAPAKAPGAVGRRPKYGDQFALARPATWPEPAHATVTETTRYGIATAAAGTDYTPPDPPHQSLRWQNAAFVEQADQAVHSVPGALIHDCGLPNRMQQDW